MSDEKPSRDYKGWISLIIGACAVWVAYESFAWQKSQAGEDKTNPTESTMGTDAANPGQHSYQQTSSGSSSSSSGDKPVESSEAGPPSNKHDKGNKNDKKKK